MDSVFANNEHRIVKSGVVPVPLSDHFLVFCIIKAGITTKAKPLELFLLVLLLLLTCLQNFLSRLTSITDSTVLIMLYFSMMAD